MCMPQRVFSCHNGRVLGVQDRVFMCHGNLPNAIFLIWACRREVGRGLGFRYLHEAGMI